MEQLSINLNEKIYSEAIICNKLDRKYINNCKYKLANAFIFRWESDFFVQKDNGYAYEFEVKISRSDFFNDKKKVEKHQILQTGKYSFKSRKSHYDYSTEKYVFEDVVTEYDCQFRPNKFFYVVPEGLILTNEIPAYAGLMYVPKESKHEIIIVKEAPFIHKNKLNYEKILCNKFYHYWLEEKRKLNEFKRQLKIR